MTAEQDQTAAQGMEQREAELRQQFLSERERLTTDFEREKDLLIKRVEQEKTEIVER